ncbi:alpha/beta fold hydrolase [Streptomyces ovatisporus]|uniref:Alpha/beta fold hydrolase n=1 Tax=Streptomyces ovatisporus TaxID=1128682 RepID=A0ABV9A4J6_9ACTN
MERDRAIGLSERLGALTTLNSSLEYLTQRKQILPGGMNDWAILRGSRRSSNPLLRKVFDAVSEPRATTAIHASRAAVAASLLLPGNHRWRGAANLYLSVSGMLIYPRHIFGTDGTDQVSLTVQGATGAARLVRSEEAKDALAWYVALQSCLSYSISGWVKLFGPAWRDGSALPGIMRTRTYGHEGMWAWTQRHPRTAKYLTHSVLALECGFPVLYAFGGRLIRPVIGSAVLFHGANAYLMGLGRFLTAFTSMHPLVAYTAVPKSHPVGAKRDDRILPLFAAALAVAGARAVLFAAQRRTAVIDGPPDSRKHTARSGNTLQYRVHTHGEAGQPVVVFEAGLSATPEHFAWITGNLATETELGLVSYARAGYAGSSRNAEGPYRLRESVDDLVDLVRATVGEERKVILAGHSLGGELVRRAAPLLGDQLEGVVYLDSSHPAELNRSAQQSESAAMLRKLFTHMTWFLRLGTGALLERPHWVHQLPKYAGDSAFAQYADSRLWSAAAREWAALEEDFRSFRGDLPPTPGRGLVISAQGTVDSDPQQLLMHDELAKAHVNGAQSLVVEGATHDGILTTADHAIRAARAIARFAAGSVETSDQQQEAVQ